ncbi:MAG: hypothetical protein H0T89_01395 [Deltaproteobacteria bacterium]|nr:hypothetical protein [Deltaproteobacteria bacterium]
MAPLAQAMSPGAVRPPRPTECAPMPSMPQSINVPPGYGQGTYERHETSDIPAVDSSAAAGHAYLVQLATLARELVAQAGGRADVAAIRVRQRLTQWVEDVRSVGGLDKLASDVEQLVNRLSAALAGGTPGPEVTAVAAELARLAAGATPVAGAPGGKPRRSFWK